MFDSSNNNMAISPCRANGEKKHWWLTNRKIVENYVREAKSLIATHKQSEISSALKLLDSALAYYPRYELALELKARCLLYVRRFKDVADMLQDYIPSLRMLSSSSSDDSSSTTSSENSSSQLSKERVKLLSRGGLMDNDEPLCKCFSVSDLKKKFISGIFKSCEKEGQWRYLVLGQACYHLGLMEDAMVLLQTGKRLATAAFRRESICWPDDSFSFSRFPIYTTNNQPITEPKTEAESIVHLLAHIKLLLRRKTAAISALDAGLYSEAIRHFSKIIDARHGALQGFLAECYLSRASAYRSAGRLAEAIADCNRTLALNPSCIEALSIRASLFESVRCLPDSLHDLEHLKLLYNTILRDRKLPGPAWKRQSVQYREIPGKLCSLATKIQELKQRVASGETGNVDNYALIGLTRGCTRSELERAHLLLILRHKPEKSISFIERCEFANETDADAVRDRAKMSSLFLYRLIQRGYTSLMSTIRDEEVADKQSKKASAALQAMQVQQQITQEPAKASLITSQGLKHAWVENKPLPTTNAATRPVFDDDQISDNKATNVTNTSNSATGAVYQGVFCRDLTIVGNLLSQTSFNHPLPMKYEALSC
ncbi:hypothetical protein LIER_22359 [Lithospermum erythrorhizon]|uniref:Uncharacterized protein n=1 Tax=Lithospermum erythrorhizon TaxID=34254 RepID=A0AAV3QTM5_LITER